MVDSVIISITVFTLYYKRFHDNTLLVPPLNRFYPFCPQSRVMYLGEKGRTKVLVTSLFIFSVYQPLFLYGDRVLIITFDLTFKCRLSYYSNEDKSR